MRKRLALLLVLLLVAAMTVQAQDYDVEDGGEIAVGDFVEGELEVGLRVQYTLEVEEDAEINITLDGETDMYLRVYEADDDEPFAENDDRGDGTLNSALYNLEVSEGDELIIEVGSYNDAGEGDYLLTVRAPAEQVDQGTIGVGDEVEGAVDENTRSVYALDVPGGAAVTITVEGADDDTDPVLRVYAEGYETPLVNDDRELDDPTAELTFSAGEDTTTVLVEVATLGDLSAGDYTLSVEEAELTRDEPQALDGRSAEDVCDEAEALEDPARAQYFEAEEVLEDDVDYQAVLCTEQGAVLIDLFEEEAPITVNSFVFLAINHYFDDTTFHRVVPDFVVQGGDPTGTGAGGPGYEFVNETDNDLSFGDEGVVGMANAGPDTNGSQFFITLAPVDQLDGDYTIFGEVLEGQDVVQDIEERDPSIAEEPGDALYTIVIVTE